MSNNLVRVMRLIGVLLTFLACIACAQNVRTQASPWTEFVRVEGQPELVPAQWVSTPEGSFAHSIKLPNPLPKNSGYRKGMSSQEYFEHLCKTEAGEFIYRTVDNVEGFYFMRPPKRPTDADLKDLYRLEAPEIERYYQLLRSTPADRSTTFVFKDIRPYRFIEEPAPLSKGTYIRAFGFSDQTTPIAVQTVNELKSRHGLTWRGIRRPFDRELSIAGGEWIILDLATGDILAVARNYGLTGRTPNMPDGIWWLNAIQCPLDRRFSSAAEKGRQLFKFVSEVIRPRVSGGVR